MNNRAFGYDEIHIEDLEIFANHGVYPEETALGQKFIVSMTLFADTRKAGRSDDLDMSVNYGEVSHFVTSYMKEHTYKLIEAAAENLAEAVLLRFRLLKGIELEIKKPWAPIGLPVAYASVRVRRFWHRAYIALGSNMGDTRGYLDRAVQLLNSAEDTEVRKVSSYIVTEPYGGVEQDDFLNACLEAVTLLNPEELLERLHEIEQDANRERIIRWGPRTLDLDILLYDDLIYESEDLIIPHVEMHKREFVLRPLSEIAPNVRHPIMRKTIYELLNEL